MFVEVKFNAPTFIPVASIDPVLTAVATTFVVNKVATVAVVTLALVACKLAEVRPVDRFNVPALTLVATTFVDVMFVE